MKSVTTVEIPLSGKEETIVFPPPCTYCGRPVPEGERSHRRFVITYKLKPDDLRYGGCLTVKAPFCEVHQKGIRIFSIIQTLSWLVGFAVALPVGLSLIFTVFSEVLTGLWSLVLGGVITLVLIIPFMWVGSLIKRQIARKNPSYEDFPTGMDGADKGYWGLKFKEVRTDSNEAPEGRREYFLPVDIKNNDTVGRLLQAFPDARVVKKPDQM